MPVVAEGSRSRKAVRRVGHRLYIGAAYYFWPVWPLLLAQKHIKEGLRDPHGSDAVISGIGWISVAVLGVLACHAVYRVVVNTTTHSRPFTKRDEWFLKMTGRAAAGVCVLNIALLIVASRLGDHKGGLFTFNDDSTAQFAVAILVSLLIGLLRDVHHRAQHAFEELEKCV